MTYRSVLVFFAGLWLVTGLTAPAHSDTVLLQETLRDWALPAGWSQTGVEFEISDGGYAHLQTTSAALTTPSFDADAYAYVRIDLSVAKDGSGEDGPITVEYSLDGGTTWDVAGDTVIPTSETFLNDSLFAEFTSDTMQIRFTRPDSASGKRLRDVVIRGLDELPTAELELDIPNSVEQGTTVQGSVMLTLSLTDDLDVDLSSSDTASVQVSPATVTIPAGTTSVMFDISAAAATESGANFSVTITAEAEGLDPASEDITYLNTLDGAIPLTTDGYSQDFTAFISEETLPHGWEAIGSVTKYEGSWGSGFSSGLRGEEHVFGYQHTGSTGVFEKRATFRNNTGGAITALTISYTGRVERANEGRSPAYVVTVAGQEVAALAYSTVGGSDEFRQAVVTGLSINEGATFTVSWVSERGGPAGSSRQIGISAFQITLDASAVPPSIAALAIPLETITVNSAEVTANVTSDGGAEIVARGFVYAETSENNNPTIGGTGVTHWLDPDAETGAMSASLTGLNPETTYSVRAYAENSAGIAYTAAQTFTTLDPPISFTGMYAQAFDDFDGTLPSGWSATADIMGYIGDWGTGTGAGFRGGVSEPGVLGYQHTAGTGTLTINASFINNTGDTIESLDVSYLGRVARISEGRSPEWTVSVDGDPVPALSYSTDNTAGPEDVPGDILVSTTVTGLNIQDGESFTITWVSDRGGPSGASRQIGIADVTVSVNGDLEPPEPGIVDVTDFSAAPGEPVRVSFVGAAGVAYQLQYTTDLTADPVIWTPVDGAQALGDGVTTIVLEDDDLSDTMRIYRLVEGDI